MTSQLLEGTVMHRRARPFRYGFEHAVWYAAIDLDELDTLVARSRLLRRNRRAIVSFHDADHLEVPGADVATGIRDHLRSVGEAPDDWRISLVASPRVLGYAFNPASFYLCRGPDGTLRIVVVEVHNTFGERHLYTLRPAAGAASGPPDRPFLGAMDKDFFVSPFIDMTGRYTVRVRDDHAGLRIAINERQGDAPLLATSLVLRRMPFSDRTLLRLLVRHPLTTHRTIGLIHWHALRLWLKGAPFFRHRVGVRHREAVR